MAGSAAAVLQSPKRAVCTLSQPGCPEATLLQAAWSACCRLSAALQGRRLTTHTSSQAGTALGASLHLGSCQHAQDGGTHVVGHLEAVLDLGKGARDERGVDPAVHQEVAAVAQRDRRGLPHAGRVDNLRSREGVTNGGVCPLLHSAATVLF